MERIPEEVLRTYEVSESYQKLKILRNEGREILQRYYRKYKDSLPYFKEETAKKLDHERYGTGMTLPRGRLCPGNMQELIIGNVKRGRIVKEYVNPGYVYGYDKEDNLITSDMVEGEIRDREYIFWGGPNIQIGLCYNELLGLECGTISEVCYNEQRKIRRYMLGQLYHGKITSIVMEEYKYEGDEAFVTFIDSSIDDEDGYDYIAGEHIVLLLDEQGTVLKYKAYMDMTPEEVIEKVPRYKLTL